MKWDPLIRPNSTHRPASAPEPDLAERIWDAVYNACEIKQREHQDATAAIRRVLAEREAAVGELLGAADKLAARLDEMEGPVNGIVAFAFVHGVPYCGPNWGQLLQEVRAAIAKVREGLPASTERSE